MKIKQFDKKLSLNKNTVANLGKEEMSKVNGGNTDYFSCIMEISCVLYTMCIVNGCDA